MMRRARRKRARRKLDGNHFFFSCYLLKCETLLAWGTTITTTTTTMITMITTVEVEAGVLE